MLALACPRAADCGGCPLLGVSVDEARAMRETRVRHELRAHLGPHAESLPLEWVALEQPLGYRRRIRLRISDEATVEFFNPGKYRDCPVLTPPLRRTLTELLARTAQLRAALRHLLHLELREPDLDGIAAAYFAKRLPEQSLPLAATHELERMLDGMRWAVAHETPPIPCQRLALPGVWHSVPIGSFLQINQAINQRLVTDLVNGAQQRELRTFCDLYAGSGNFTLPLLAAGLEGSGVELDSQAIVAACQAATAQSLPDHGFVAADAGQFAIAGAGRGQGFDLVIVDPPRAGVKHGLGAMAALAQKCLVYCSCNPHTLARDLRVLVDAQFEIESVTLYDMFAHTEHVESMAWLRAPARTFRR